MTSATINLSAVIDTIGGTAAAPVRFTAQVMRGGQPAIRFQGALATVPTQLVAYWTGTEWKPSAPALTDVDEHCRWHVELAKVDGTARLQREVLLPTLHGGSVDFGDLVDVDPATQQPYSPAPSVRELAAEAAATLAQVQAAVGSLAVDGGSAAAMYVNTVDIDGGTAA